LDAEQHRRVLTIVDSEELGTKLSVTLEELQITGGDADGLGGGPFGEDAGGSSGAWANQEDWGGEGSSDTGSHNYWHHPTFCAPDAGDYHIGPGSGALDKGINTETGRDIDGDPRPIGAAPDIGADEIWQLRLPLTVKSARTAESGHTREAARDRVPLVPGV
jgi:hypothetical protein